MWYYYKSFFHWGMHKIYIEIDLKHLRYDEIDQRWFGDEQEQEN